MPIGGRKMHKIKLKTNKNTLTFYEGFNLFILNCKAKGLRTATIEHYRIAYNQIIKIIDKDTILSELNLKKFNEFIIKSSDESRNSQTVYSLVRDFKTILNYFIKSNYINSFEMKLPRVDKRPIETYSDEELELLLKKPDLKKCSFCTYRNYVMVCFFLSTGIRLSSLTNIKIKNLKLSESEVEILHTKNRKPLIVPLNSNINKILIEYLSYRQSDNSDDYLFCNVYGKQLKKSTIIQAVANYNNECGVVTTSIHKLRHTFAKKWILGGNDVVALQKILGHSSLQMTQNYINILVSDLKKDVEKYNILQEFGSVRIKMKKEIINN